MGRLPATVLRASPWTEFLGHRDVSTTIYTHVLNRGRRGVRSPLDLSR